MFKPETFKLTAESPVVKSNRVSPQNSSPRKQPTPTQIEIVEHSKQLRAQIIKALDNPYDKGFEVPLVSPQSKAPDTQRKLNLSPKLVQLLPSNRSVQSIVPPTSQRSNPPNAAKSSVRSSYQPQK